MFEPEKKLQQFVSIPLKEYQSYKKFSAEIQNQLVNYKRESCFAFQTKHLDFESLHGGELETDNYTVAIEGIPFNCLYINKQSKKLFVVFSGSTNGDTPPIFRRWSYFPYINANILLISDPMYGSMFKDLMVGWYYGTKDKDLTATTANCVKKFQNFLQIGDTDTTFFGSSGGGYIAIRMAAFFDKSTHIAINPQIQLFKYKSWYVEKFMRITGNDLNDKSDARNDLSPLIASTKNTVIIQENVDSYNDIFLQCKPVFGKLKINDLSLGIVRKKNICFWLYYANGGHNAQGKQYEFYFLLQLAKKIKNGTFGKEDDILYKDITYRMFIDYKASELPPASPQKKNMIM